jgi:hypothetical protein
MHGQKNIKNFEALTQNRGADKSLTLPTSWCIFYGENISFDASLVICMYIYIYI